MPNTYYTDYTDFGVVYTNFEVRAQDQGIKVGQDAHQEGYFNDRYLENSIIYQQTFCPDKLPGHYNVELYTIVITYPPKVQ